MFCKKVFLTNFAKFTRKHLRKRLVFNEVADLQSFALSKQKFRHRCFLVNIAKFLMTLLKNSSDGCFCINTRSVYCPSTTFCFFQKRCHTHFLAEYFLGLIYRLGTRVRPIFQTLSQTPIFNLV